MTDPSGLDIDVSDLSGQQADAWFRRMAFQADANGPGNAAPVKLSNPRELVGRWLGLRAHRTGCCGGVVAARIHRDGTAEVVVPECGGRFDPPLVTILLDHTATQLAHRGVRLAVIYLPNKAESLLACSRSAGFRRSGDLLVLSRSVGDDCLSSPPRNSRDWTWEPCVFGQGQDLPIIFERTLIGSRDFPNLPHVGSIESMLERFAEVGCDDTPMWYLARYRENLAGCLLMTARRDCQVADLQYVGLAPEYRGRGGGRIMVRYALDVMGNYGVATVVVGVHAENDPAIAIYASMGFDPAFRRAVFFRQLAANQDGRDVHGDSVCSRSCEASQGPVPGE